MVKKSVGQFQCPLATAFEADIWSPREIFQPGKLSSKIIPSSLHPFPKALQSVWAALKSPPEMRKKGTVAENVACPYVKSANKLRVSFQHLLIFHLLTHWHLIFWDEIAFVPGNWHCFFFLFLSLQKKTMWLLFTAKNATFSLWPSQKCRRKIAKRYFDPRKTMRFVPYIRALDLLDSSSPRRPIKTSGERLTRS